MRRIRKSITTRHGISCNAWNFSEINLKFLASGDFLVTGNISLYLNSAARESDSEPIDNAIFSVEMTKQELRGDFEKKIYQKLMISKIQNIEGVDVETNTLQTSHSGQITLVGGEFVEVT